MFICEKNHSCCDFQYWDRQEDVEQEAKECGHLIEVAPVTHGRWDWVGIWECSKCKYHWTHPTSPTANYCPNCGARMDGE